MKSRMQIRSKIDGKITRNGRKRGEAREGLPISVEGRQRGLYELDVVGERPKKGENSKPKIVNERELKKKYSCRAHDSRGEVGEREDWQQRQWERQRGRREERRKWRERRGEGWEDRLDKISIACTDLWAMARF